MRRLDTAWITSPMNRCCLIHVSQTCNLMSSIAIVRLNKTLGRNSVSLDGRCPTLTDGCTNMFVPAAATTLSLEQLVCLTGVHPEQHPDVFECISRIGWVGKVRHSRSAIPLILFRLRVCLLVACPRTSKTEMDSLVAGAMTLPVVGNILAVALSLMRP